MHIVELANVLLGLFLKLNDQLLDLSLILFDLPFHLLFLRGELFGISLILLALEAPLLQLRFQGFTVPTVLVQKGLFLMVQLLDFFVMTLSLLFKLPISLGDLSVVFLELLGLLDADFERLSLLSEKAEERLELAHTLLFVFLRLFQALAHKVVTLL